MRKDHFKAEPYQNGGYTWTLASRLGAMLNEAETKYGPRDKNYTFLGVEFGPDAVPHTWYPGDRGHIIIQLTMNAVDDLPISIYQLAHECIHLLAPTGKPGAPVIEEGLATIYSEEKFSRCSKERA